MYGLFNKQCVKYKHSKLSRMLCKQLRKKNLLQNPTLPPSTAVILYCTAITRSLEVKKKKRRSEEETELALQ